MGAQTCVVIVEDEPMLLGLLRDVLALQGYDSRGFHHPYLLDSIEVRPDLFLIDIMLPARNGVEVAERLRAAGHKTTPMIAMSASDAMLKQAAASGLFQEGLPKPFDVDHLLERVAHYV